MYKPIDGDKQNLTIMGIKFSSPEALDRAANAIGSNMFEGFEPTPLLIELYRDYTSGSIKEHQQLLEAAL
jgi:putative transcriptional regulator